MGPLELWNFIWILINSKALLSSHLTVLKFGLSEKHTKFEKKNLPHGFDKSTDLLSKRQNHEEDFFKFCVLLKKSELYKETLKPIGTN